MSEAGVWARRLRPASFRGVPFKVDSHDYGSGRKIVSHETVGDEIVFSEDMGKKSENFNMKGFVIGDDVFRLRDNLISELNKEGAGELVHPYLGNKSVKVVGFNVSEGAGDGRRAMFTIEFIEAGKPNFPKSIFDVVTEFFDSANDAIDAVKAEFEAIYKIASLPSFVLDEATVTLNNALGVVDKAIQKIRSIPEEKAKFEKRLQDLKNKITQTASSADSLVDETSSLITGTDAIIKELEVTDAIDVESGNDDRLTVYDSMIDLGSNQIVDETGTPNDIQVSKNKVAINKLNRRIAIVTLGGSSILKAYPTIQDATKQKEKLVDLLDSVLEDDIDDNTYQIFSDLKGYIIKAIPNDSASLQNEVEINIIGFENSLTAIYKLTGNITLESDFIKRNKINNPSYLSPQTYKAINE